MKIITIYDIDKKSFLIKPDTALLRNNDAYYIPSFTQEVEVRPFVSVKITRLAKSIDKQFSSRLWETLSVAVELRAADVLATCKREGRPWDIALSYDKSTAVSNDSVASEDDLFIEVQKGDSILFSENVTRIADRINATLSIISQTVTLKIGDMVLLPLSDEGMEVKIGDYITASCGDTSLLDFDIK